MNWIRWKEDGKGEMGNGKLKRDEDQRMAPCF
jgi:hypothetical protein